ncbi:chemotaxis protein methyltransferase [Burkholderia mallei SAVP1]|nr:chemotaxis protein methyltransferase [Burkholderia mallei SAVP1]
MMPARAASRLDAPEPQERSGDAARDFEFTSADFTKIRALIHRRAGISLSEHKRDMAYSRLARRLRARGLNRFCDYLELLERENDPSEWEAFTNSLTTNLTAFFRESHHFPILAEFVKRREQPVSVWCSAASTGEEPYSIAMTRSANRPRARRASSRPISTRRCSQRPTRASTRSSRSSICRPSGSSAFS